MAAWPIKRRSPTRGRWSTSRCLPGMMDLKRPSSCRPKARSCAVGACFFRPETAPVGVAWIELQSGRKRGRNAGSSIDYRKVNWGDSRGTRRDEEREEEERENHRCTQIYMDLRGGMDSTNLKPSPSIFLLSFPLFLSVHICVHLWFHLFSSAHLRVLCGQSQQRSIFTGDDPLGQPHAGFDLGRWAKRRERSVFTASRK